jgi:hypothetical protein
LSLAGWDPARYIEFRDGRTVVGSIRILSKCEVMFNSSAGQSSRPATRAQRADGLRAYPHGSIGWIPGVPAPFVA